MLILLRKKHLSVNREIDDIYHMNAVEKLSNSISSKRADYIFIIGSPILAFLAIALFCEPRFKNGNFLYNPQTPHWLIIAALLLTKSHILLVFLRSHFNKNIYKRFPLRFTIIPILLLMAMWVSPLFLGMMGFIALYWDEWHSLMQTFGFGRIYDAKLGNDPEVGRKLDIGMCFVLGLLPHVILLTFIPETIRTEGLYRFMDIDREIAIKYGDYFSATRFPLIGFGVGYVIYYFYRYQLLIKNGYKFSKEKLALFFSTGISAILIASFYSVADAAYFGNIYHAIQYYFIVYMSEGVLITKRIKAKEEIERSQLIFYFGMVLIVCIILAALRIKSEEFGVIVPFWLLTSLMHFWYDGFIWSVRKQDI
jgi:hypothetical protein